MHHTRLILMPVMIAPVPRPIPIIAAIHHMANSCLLAAIVIVVGDEHGAEAVDRRFVLVAEVMGQEFQPTAIGVAPPDGACLTISLVGVPNLAVLILEVLHSLVADAEVELAIGAEMDAMHAMIVIVPAKAGQKNLRRAIRLAIAIL